jgi:hypothetical protein
MIIATIADGRKKNRMPQIRLTIALPLVSCLPGAVVDGKAGAAAGEARFVLQNGQT